MSKPYIHAQIDAKQLGGEPDDYIEIHEFMDSSKAALPDFRHRTLTHNIWFITVVLPRVSGEAFRRKSDGKRMSTRDIGERHVAQDFHGFIPTAQDYLAEMEVKPWMMNGQGSPPSMAKITHRKSKPKPKTDEYRKA